MMFELDFTNMMEESIGPGLGIAETDLDDVRRKGRAIHDAIEARRGRGELPFFNLPFDREGVDEVLALAERIRSRFDDVVVLGIGGSALGTTAVLHALRPAWHNLASSEQRGGLPRLFVLDNVDPDGFADHLDLFDPARTCFLVISKSGSTVETICQFLVARDWLTATASLDYRDHFILITDPETGALRDLAKREGLQSCAIPSGVGGRFSVFTPVSLLPLACAGIDVRSMLDGAAALAPHVCGAELMENPAYLNAGLQYLAYRKGAHISVMMPYSDRLLSLADWFRQLWAESLGKKKCLDGSLCHVGPTPISALGTTDQHSQVQLYMEGPFDKLVTFVAVERFDRDFKLGSFADLPAVEYLAGSSMSQLIKAEQQATAAALARNGRPNCTLKIPDVSAKSVGALLYLLQVQTLFAGALFGIDPLDQPGVEEGKAFTYALMGRAGYEQKKQEFDQLRSRVPHRILHVG